jgi:hypothetical protein
MSLIYYVADLEYEVETSENSDKDSLFASLLDQKGRRNLSQLENSVTSTDIMYLLGLVKGFILTNLERYEMDLIQAGSRYFGLSETSPHLHAFLIPSILHEFLFGNFQNTKMSLEIFSELYQMEIHVS